MITQALLIILAVPVGFLIAYLARDELVAGREWFKLIILLSFVTAAWAWLARYFYVALTCFFIAIVAIISLIKSKDKKWTKRP